MIINVVNRKAVTNIELARVIAGVNAQIALDFAPYWGMPCIVRAGLPVQTTKPAFQDTSPELSAITTEQRPAFLTASYLLRSRKNSASPGASRSRTKCSR